MKYTIEKLTEILDNLSYDLECYGVGGGASNIPVVRLAVAKQGYALEKLKNDSSYRVRRAVVEQGYALEELKNDFDWEVRLAVAEKGYALEELKSDKDWNVRLAVAEKGYALEELKSDKDWCVRRAVAEKGYALEELKNDESWRVRLVVAEQGYALEELKNDESWRVRLVVAEQGYALEELKNDESWRVRLVVAEQGYALEEFRNDEHQYVRREALKGLRVGMVAVCIGENLTGKPLELNQYYCFATPQSEKGIMVYAQLNEVINSHRVMIGNQGREIGFLDSEYGLNYIIDAKILLSNPLDILTREHWEDGENLKLNEHDIYHLLNGHFLK